MKAGLVIVIVMFAVTGCDLGTSSTEPAANAVLSVASRLATESTLDPLDYSDLELWPCTSEKTDDLCDDTYTAEVPLTDGVTIASKSIGPADNPPFDCFYIYPTLDFGPRAQNHEDLDKVELPLRTIVSQAAPFSSVCRVFAPLYRQASLFTYSANVEDATVIFKNAYIDVAQAFEYYLQHWNEGRPIVIMGHSQGAQHATYLLHTYFDGDKTVSTITGSTTSGELRDRLILGLPIGFRLFAQQGEMVGGSLAGIPACTSEEETGCVIHYRSYSEGDAFTGLDRVVDFAVDGELARQGLLHRSIDLSTDELLCVNPATRSVIDIANHVDINGDSVESGDVRQLTSAQFLGAIGSLSGADEGGRLHMEHYYSATCRHDARADNYLAIGLPGPSLNDKREDPVSIDSQLTTGTFGSLGLHLWDFSLAMGDLIEQVRVRGNAYARRN